MTESLLSLRRIMVRARSRCPRAVRATLLASEETFDWVPVGIDHRYEGTIEHMALLADHIPRGGLLLFDDRNTND